MEQINSRTLIIFTTYTGNTEIIANRLSKDLGITEVLIEEILRVNTEKPIRFPPKKSFFPNFFQMMKIGSVGFKKTDIMPLKANLENFDKIILGAPLHGGNVAYSMKLFLEKNKDILLQIDLAFFQLSGGPQGKAIDKVKTVLKEYKKEIVCGVIQGTGGFLSAKESKTEIQYQDFLSKIKKEFFGNEKKVKDGENEK